MLAKDIGSIECTVSPLKGLSSHCPSSNFSRVSMDRICSYYGGRFPVQDMLASICEQLLQCLQEDCGLPELAADGSGPGSLRWGQEGRVERGHGTTEIATHCLNTKSTRKSMKYLQNDKLQTVR